ncbi:Hypothetical Protein RradSPS_3019 (plasmid) [Rubrobacter radiotolerans]|uniref:DUF7973 domain-containing protein n=1 Tax=Rubrobacter radiotolerans TaxID=42256 RepID=A0A023X781_RUBRA|nr:hypothetical protein [Rubrobacter radiotolerans]AHY48302.1 Hypothetical Protein RradSPS_3019 [Rubrobacter radiotolerans]MDX5895575.1 hypothetical protein [Rubrobacter radiotolerans]SMC01499.1 conserved hypothetical protein [Rubrobacter radiotolerans DSM 5868]
MEFSVLLLLAAFGGGLFGAAIGGQPAFIFTGFMVFIGIGTALAGVEYDFLGNVAFGPVFGPHVAFGGAVAAAAYAARVGDLDSGRDIASPVAGMGKPGALVVGGVFGAGAYVVKTALDAVLVVPGDAGLFYTDTVALTVGISAVVARLAFGKTGLFGSVSVEANERGRFFPGGEQVWVIHQQGFAQASVLGVGTGLLGGFIVASMAQINPDSLAFSANLGFGIAAASLIVLQFGFNGPVTHHMILPGGLAAAAVLASGGPDVAAIIAAAVAGVAGALLGEVYSRLFLIHGDTHIDPPALAIFTMTTVIVLFRVAFGAV